MSCIAYRLLGHHAVNGGGIWAGGLMALDASCSIRCRVGSGHLGEPGENVGEHLDWRWEMEKDEWKWRGKSMREVSDVYNI